MDGHVGRRGTQQWVSDDDGVDHPLTGDRVERDHGQVCRKQRHDLRGRGYKESGSSTSHVGSMFSSSVEVNEQGLVSPTCLPFFIMPWTSATA